MREYKLQSRSNSLVWFKFTLPDIDLDPHQRVRVDWRFAFGNCPDEMQLPDWAWKQVKKMTTLDTKNKQFTTKERARMIWGILVTHGDFEEVK